MSLVLTSEKDPGVLYNSLLRFLHLRKGLAGAVTTPPTVSSVYTTVATVATCPLALPTCSTCNRTCTCHLTVPQACHTAAPAAPRLSATPVSTNEATVITRTLALSTCSTCIRTCHLTVPEACHSAAPAAPRLTATPCFHHCSPRGHLNSRSTHPFQMPTRCTCL